MRRVPPPSAQIEDVYPACIGKVNDPAQLIRLTDAQADVIRMSSRLYAALQDAHVHDLVSADFLDGSTVHGDLETLYSKHFAKAGSPGREIYDSIRALMQWCWACGHQAVQTLDHYLPKSKFPALSITPMNLTPMCWDCNKAKRTAVANSRETTFIHPYVDDFDSDIWLGATVVETPEPHVGFHAVGEWGPSSLARLEHHLNKYKLHERYGVEAARLVAQNRRSLEKAWLRGGREEVRFEAMEHEETHRECRRNSWQAATWAACATSDWFCERGYLRFTE